MSKLHDTNSTPGADTRAEVLALLGELLEYVEQDTSRDFIARRAHLRYISIIRQRIRASAITRDVLHGINPPS